MTSPRIQGASHVLSECSDAGPSYSVESVRSCVGSKKLIPSPPHVEDILDWEWVNTEFKSDIAPQSQKMILSDAPLMSLVPYYCDVVKCLMKEAPLLLAPHQTPINEAQCRWDISLVSNPPIGMSFGPQNITVITSQESHHQHVFLIRFAETHFPYSLKTTT